MVNVVVLPLITYVVVDVITVTMSYRACFHVVGINYAVVTHPTWETHPAVSVWARIYIIAFLVIMRLAFTPRVVNACRLLLLI